MGSDRRSDRDPEQRPQSLKAIHQPRSDREAHDPGPGFRRDERSLGTALLDEYVPGAIWLCRYPVSYMGAAFDARMTVIRLRDGRLMLHSPCPIDGAMKAALSALGPIAYLVAPGTYHYLNIASAQAAFPAAETFLCPGIERKRPELKFDWLLGDTAPDSWRGQIDQVLVRGARWIWEVAFFHRDTRTLILVDLVENFTDRTPHANWALKLWWKAVFRMWNNPMPAPEYQWGWQDKPAARQSLLDILKWTFDRVIVSHGDLIETDARQTLEQAWKAPLAGGTKLPAKSPRSGSTR